MIAHVRHEARLSQPVRDGKGKPAGTTQRAALEHAARRGSASAIQQLASPPCPPELDYLRRWAYELTGRSGFSEVGMNPLTYGTIESWARLTGRHPSPADVDALLRLDDVLRNPGEAK